MSKKSKKSQSTGVRLLRDFCVANKLPPPPSCATKRKIRASLRSIDSITSAADHRSKVAYKRYRHHVISISSSLNSGLFPVCPIDNGRRAVLTLHSSRGILPREVQDILKWAPRREDLNALHKSAHRLLCWVLVGPSSKYGWTT
jgi:hypothetical protein